MLKAFSGQKLVSTHSGELLSGIPLSKIRRLCRQNGKVCVHQIKDGVLSNEELEKLDYKVRMTRGSLLFSRCWLLLEGETEATLIPQCATALGVDLYSEGVSCVEFAQVGLEKYIKLADELGINWLVLVDGDTAGKNYSKQVKQQLNGRTKNDHLYCIPNENIEIYLCDVGFGDIYEQNISNQKKHTVTSQVGTLQYWTEITRAQVKNSKPKSAFDVSQRMLAHSETIPDLLKSVVLKAQALARSAG